MPLHKDVIERFLLDLANLPVGNASYSRLENILAPALEAEKNLRISFTTNNPLILSNPHIGLIDAFSILPIPITIGRDRSGVNFNAQHILPFHSLEDHMHPHRLPDGNPAIVPMERFQENWKIFTSGFLWEMDWRNVVAAGGAVLACLKSTIPEDMTKMEIMDIFQSDLYSGSDIDLFLYGLSTKEVSCCDVTSSDIESLI